MASRIGQSSITPIGSRRQLGATVAAAGVNYCVWGPDLASLSIEVTSPSSRRRVAMAKDQEGFWAARDTQGNAGDLYRLELPDGRLLPDPASRFQPHGVHEASECIEPRSYRWKMPRPTPAPWRGQAIYELHVGTFTSEGTYRAAIGRLDAVAALGVEMIQLMPLADFAGERNWGYDGVQLYAPAHCYGRPDDLRALVEAAHARGLGVILDVVYNHLGPVGNCLAAFCPDYFSAKHRTPWGPAFRLDGARGRVVRDFLLGNVAYWMDEFRIDGFRLDATHTIPTTPERHLLAEISDLVHARGGFVIAEDERNLAELMADSRHGGLGLDAVWSDDLHHQVRVALTGQRHSYFASYEGTAAALADVVEHGQTFRGQAFPFWNGRRRGNASHHLATDAFVVCIENHDQVGNRARGERLEHTISSRKYRAASLFLCLGPYVPMLFMGQEWAATSPFLFFTDFDAEHGRLVTEGRRREFEAIGLIAEAPAEFPDPQDPATFERSKLDWTQRRNGEHAQILALYREALTLRREWSRRGLFQRGNWRVALLGEVVALRYAAPEGDYLLLIALAGGSVIAHAEADILLLPPRQHWSLRLASEETRFGAAEPASPTPLEFTGPAVALYTLKTEDHHAAA